MAGEQPPKKAKGRAVAAKAKVRPGGDDERRAESTRQEKAAPKETKAERTRTAIIDAALKLFREKGYDATTMRAIAAEAGVSVGNAYYYFDSKERLIQGFYGRAQVEHEQACRSVLEAETDLGARIVGVVDAWLATMAPYRQFAGKFFKNAAEPTSPLSPFSPESSPARAAAIDLWRTVLEGSDAKVPAKLRTELPELLWLYFMGLVLFWVYDPTADASATRSVAARTAPLVVRAIGLTRLPILRGMVDDIVGLIGEIRQIFPIVDPGLAPGGGVAAAGRAGSASDGRAEPI